MKKNDPISKANTINDIINNKELINDDATNMADVIDTFNALEEILSFDSTAGITRITA